MLRFGAVLENVLFYDDHHRVVNYHDISLTENTRASYPLEFINNAKIPAVGGHPKNIIFLTCDAFGVLPPVAKLTPEQAMYHFIAGYTAKVAGTEVIIIFLINNINIFFVSFIYFIFKKYHRLVSLTLFQRSQPASEQPFCLFTQQFTLKCLLLR